MERRSKCLRTLQDEEAGLLFRWRIGRGSIRRTMVAVLLAAVLCGAGILLVRVEGSQGIRNGREAARVTVLTPGSEASRRWLAWAHQEAPYLDRWEPFTGGALRARMDRIEALLLAETRHEALLHPAEQRSVKRRLPPILDPIRPGLPQVKRAPERLEAFMEEECYITAKADGVLRARWGDPSPSSPMRDLLMEGRADHEGMRSRELLGLERRFLVSVNRRGVIETCQVLDPDDRKLDELLARWLRRQRLKPGKEELVWGEVRVGVRGLRGEEKRQEAEQK